MRGYYVLFLWCLAVNAQFRAQSTVYLKPDSIAARHPVESIENLPKLVDDLTFSLESDLEKFRAIYTWICTHIKNDYGAYQITVSKRKKSTRKPEKYQTWNKKFSRKVLNRLVQQHKTACTGYAYLVKEMSTIAGIDCRVIDGWGKTSGTSLDKNSLPNHSWNAVKIDDKWYLCDATWSAGSIVWENNEPAFKFDYRDCYFLADPELFALNHFPTNPYWLLLKKPFAFEMFLESPLPYFTAFEKAIIPTTPQTMVIKARTNKKIPFDFVMKDTLDTKKIVLKIVKNGSVKTVYPEIASTGEQFNFELSFSSRGICDVHLYYDENPMYSYVVKVSKQ